MDLAWTWSGKEKTHVANIPLSRVVFQWFHPQVVLDYRNDIPIDKMSSCKSRRKNNPYSSQCMGHVIRRLWERISGTTSWTMLAPYYVRVCSALIFVHFRRSQWLIPHLSITLINQSVKWFATISVTDDRMIAISVPCSVCIVVNVINVLSDHLLVT